MSILVDNLEFNLEGNLGYWQGNTIGDATAGSIQWNIKIPKGLMLKRIWFGGYTTALASLPGVIQLRTGKANQIFIAALNSANAFTIGASTYRSFTGSIPDNIPPVKDTAGIVGNTKAIITVLLAGNTNLALYQPSIIAEFYSNRESANFNTRPNPLGSV